MFVLASASPRRQSLLEQLGYRFRVQASDIPEEAAQGETPADYVQRVALAKARATAALLDHPELVLGADTEVVMDGRIYGKPRDESDACAMLHSLQGRSHEVLSAVALHGERGAEVVLQRSLVCFAPLSAQEIRDYVASGEAMGKAGAYAIQGRAAAFVSHLEGSFSGVMGLPLHETAKLLARFGVQPG